MHLGPASEPRRVVVAQRLGVPEGFQHRVGVKDALLHGVLRPCDLGQEIEALFRRLRLAGPRLSGDENSLQNKHRSTPRKQQGRTTYFSSAALGSFLQWLAVVFATFDQYIVYEQLAVCESYKSPPPGAPRVHSFIVRSCKYVRRPW